MNDSNLGNERAKGNQAFAYPATDLDILDDYQRRS